MGGGGGVGAYSFLSHLHAPWKKKESCSPFRNPRRLHPGRTGGACAEGRGGGCFIIRFILPLRKGEKSLRKSFFMPSEVESCEMLETELRSRGERRDWRMDDARRKGNSGHIWFFLSCFVFCPLEKKKKDVLAALPLADGIIAGLD